MSEVASHPEVMWGRTVTVSARVERVAGPHAALLGNDALLVGEYLLIVSEPELREQVLLASLHGAMLSEGDVVQVTGTVRRYKPEALEEELGFPLGDGAVADYQGPSVLVVESIDLDVPISLAAGDKEFGSGSSGYDFGVTIDDIVVGTDDYAGLAVTVSDEIEEEILTQHVFLIGDQHLLIISADPLPDVFVEATAYVTGEVGTFGLERVERELGIDLDDDALRPFEGKPFVLADSVLVVT